MSFEDEIEKRTPPGTTDDRARTLRSSTYWSKIGGENHVRMHDERSVRSTGRTERDKYTLQPNGSSPRCLTVRQLY